LGEEDERFAPAEITGFGGDGGGDAGLGDVEVGAAEHFFQLDSDVHFSGEVGVVEFVGVADAFVRDEFSVDTAEGVAGARGEVGEGHFVGAADFGFEVVDFAGEAVGREPFGLGVGVEEGAIDAFGRGPEDSVEADGVSRVGGHREWLVCFMTNEVEKLGQWNTTYAVSTGGGVGAAVEFGEGDAGGLEAAEEEGGEGGEVDGDGPDGARVGVELQLALEEFLAEESEAAGGEAGGLDVAGGAAEEVGLEAVDDEPADYLVVLKQGKA